MIWWYDNEHDGIMLSYKIQITDEIVIRWYADMLIARGYKKNMGHFCPPGPTQHFLTDPSLKNEIPVSLFPQSNSSVLDQIVSYSIEMNQRNL